MTQFWEFCHQTALGTGLVLKQVKSSVQRMTWAVNQQIISLKWTTPFCAHGYALSQAFNSTPIRVHSDMPGFLCWVQASHQQHAIVNQATPMYDFTLTLWDVVFIFSSLNSVILPILPFGFWTLWEHFTHVFWLFPVTTRVQSLLFLVMVVVKWKLEFLYSCPVSKAGAFKKNNKCQKACDEIMRADNTGCDSSETRELSPMKLVYDQIPVIH